MTLEDAENRASELYVAGGSTPGFELDHWLQARQEILVEQEQSAYFEP
ncbi:MAG TPA: DUF2934 domain-containing protein [Bryobacteraceae bacterium]|jgi:hypothetical protein